VSIAIAYLTKYKNGVQTFCFLRSCEHTTKQNETDGCEISGSASTPQHVGVLILTWVSHAGFCNPNAVEQSDSRYTGPSVYVEYCG